MRGVRFGPRFPTREPCPGLPRPAGPRGATAVSNRIWPAGPWLRRGEARRGEAVAGSSRTDVLARPWPGPGLLYAITTPNCFLRHLARSACFTFFWLLSRRTRPRNARYSKIPARLPPPAPGPPPSEAIEPAGQTGLAASEAPPRRGRQPAVRAVFPRDNAGVEHHSHTFFLSSLLLLGAGRLWACCHRGSARVFFGAPRTSPAGGTRPCPCRAPGACPRRVRVARVVSRSGVGPCGLAALRSLRYRGRRSASHAVLPRSRCWLPTLHVPHAGSSSSSRPAAAPQSSMQPVRPVQAVPTHSISHRASARRRIVDCGPHGPPACSVAWQRVSHVR